MNEMWLDIDRDIRTTNFFIFVFWGQKLQGDLWSPNFMLMRNKRNVQACISSTENVRNLNIRLKIISKFFANNNTVSEHRNM